ncbi:Lipase [Gryllus bimaculatus]|nr:Lipase [Gryllus bimaculatus]
MAPCAAFLLLGLLAPAAVLASWDIDEDVRLDTIGLLTKYGYPAEVHEVTTDDGYILSLHRVPYSPASPLQEGKQKPVVFLQHGLLCSSADWVVMGPGAGFAYILADAGYDVWMGNARGNTYSRRHIKYKPGGLFNSKFWNFDWHEVGLYDLPASIDYVLEQTGEEKLFYAGHSMGTTAFWVMTTQRPQYNDKIRAMFALAPIAYMGHMTSPFFQLLSLANKPLEFLLNIMGVNEFLPNNELMTLGGKLLCQDKALTQFMCENVLFLIAGYDSEELNSRTSWLTLGTTCGWATLAGTAVANQVQARGIVLTASFWNFQLALKWACNDFPASSTNVLGADLARRKLFYAGQLHGTTAFWVMTTAGVRSQRKIRAMFALAPIAYMGYMTSPFFQLISLANKPLEFLLNIMGVNEFLPNNELMTLGGKLLCQDKALTQFMCENVLFLIAGYDSEELNSTMLPVILGHTPAGASTNELLHYSQEIVSFKFRQWDYTATNLFHYGSLTPPKYKLSKVTAPVALFYSGNDWLAAIKDVDKLYKEISNPIGKFKVTHSKFNHLDYLWAINVKELVYDKYNTIQYKINRSCQAVYFKLYTCK